MSCGDDGASNCVSTNRVTATLLANGEIKRHKADLGEFKSPCLNGGRRSVNRKV